jgi:hypothetical protein
MTKTTIGPDLKRLASSVDDHISKILLGVFFSTSICLYDMLQFSDNNYYGNNLWKSRSGFILHSSSDNILDAVFK